MAYVTNLAYQSIITVLFLWLPLQILLDIIWYIEDWIIIHLS